MVIEPSSCVAARDKAVAALLAARNVEARRTGIGNADIGLFGAKQRRRQLQPIAGKVPFGTQLETPAGFRGEVDVRFGNRPPGGDQ